MVRTLGVFHELQLGADFLWNQCDGPMGQAGDMVVRSGDRTADHALVMNWPVPPWGSRRSGGWKRYVYKAARRSTTPLRIKAGYQWLGRAKETTWALLYEPPPLIDDWWMDYTKQHCARVYAPDPRATHPIVLPAMWTLEDDLGGLRSLPPPVKTVPLVAVNAGRPAGKALIPGHEARLEFFRRVRAAGIPLSLFGRGLPSSLGGGGAIASKGNVLRPARFALVVENFAGGDKYVTEKLWDALLCWCLPIYYGSRAADSLLPAQSMVRLPDLGEAGLDVVRRTVADPSKWERALPAIAEARRRAIDELSIVHWLKRELQAR